MNKFLLLMLFSMGTWAFSQVDVLIKTNYGDIQLALDDKKAPVTVNNFIQYVNKDFYSGTIFHRVIRGFMIQGGGFDEKMIAKNTEQPIINEAGNGLKNTIGTVAMARTAEPNSATSQFFINVADNQFLDYKNNLSEGIGYAVFGKVSKGLDVVKKIANVDTGTVGYYSNVPKKPVKIISIEVIR